MHSPLNATQYLDKIQLVRFKVRFKGDSVPPERDVFRHFKEFFLCGLTLHIIVFFLIFFALMYLTTSFGLLRF